VPTIAEAGVPGFEVLTWYGALVPAATPKPIVAKLNAEMLAALKSPEVQEQYKHHGLEAAGNTPEAFGKFLAADLDKWRQLIKAANIKAE
jgi:tripartite-type tricarboxylate transporter receptor subunit TctC